MSHLVKHGLYVRARQARCFSVEVVRCSELVHELSSRVLRVYGKEGRKRVLSHLQAGTAPMTSIVPLPGRAVVAGAAVLCCSSDLTARPSARPK